MATSWVIKCGTSQNFSSGNHPCFHRVGGGDDGGATGAQVRLENRVPANGHISKLSIFLRLEQFVSKTAVMINGTDSALFIQTTGPTGQYENVTDRVAVSAGDLVVYSNTFVSGSGTQSYSAGKYEFDSDDGLTYTHLYGANTFFAPTLQTNNVIERGALIGIQQDVGTADDGRTQFAVSTAGIWESCFAYISPNTRVEDSFIHSRINNVQGNILVTITAGMTGQMQDSSSSDLVTENDLLNWGWENQGGGSSLRIEQCSSFISRTVRCFDVGPRANNSNQNDNSVSDNPLGGGWGSIFTGNFIAAVNRSRQAMQRYDLRIAANSLGTQAESWIQLDGSNQQQSPSLIQVPAGATGIFTSRNQTICPPGVQMRIRRQAPFSFGAWQQGHFQCEASPEVAETTEKSWQMPVVHVEGGARR